MKDYSYKDPYDGVQVFVAVDDGDEESWDKALAWLEESRKEIQSEDRRQRYNAPYHIEALGYEGTDYASPEDLAEKAADTAEAKRIYDWLRRNLTAVQYRRFRLFMDGMSIREIARLEGADYSSVRESIRAAQKKLMKLYGNTPSKDPSKSPYCEG